MRLYTARELKLAALITGALTVIAVMITIFVALGRRPPVHQQQAQVSSKVAPSVMLSEMQIPDEFASKPVESWVLSRPPVERWTSAQVKQYWVDPRSIGLGLLKQKNDTLIKDLMDKVP